MKLRKLLWATRFLTVWTGRNLLRRASPRLSDMKLRWERASGRGVERSAEEAARYFRGVLSDYEAIARHAGLVGDAKSLFEGRTVLELGPGDTLSVGLLARAKGALAYEAYDPYDLGARDEDYLRDVYGALVEGGSERARDLLRGATVHREASSLKAGGRRFDLVVSRSVLEHVDDLGALFATLSEVVKGDAVLVHKVDLRSHHNQHDHDLDFLLFPEGLYHLATSHVGMPNRVRASEYLKLAERAGLVTLWAARTHVIAADAVRAIQGELAPTFRAMPVEELQVLGLWLVQVGRDHPLAKNARRYESVADMCDAPAGDLAPF